MSLLQHDNPLYTSFPGGAPIRYLGGEVHWVGQAQILISLPLALAVNHEDCFACFKTQVCKCNLGYDLRGKQVICALDPSQWQNCKKALAYIWHGLHTGYCGWSVRQLSSQSLGRSVSQIISLLVSSLPATRCWGWHIRMHPLGTGLSMKRPGILVGKFELNSYKRPSWAWLDLNLSPTR